MINLGIMGYGNLGKGAEIAINGADDLKCVGIFTRRSPNSIKTLFNTPVFSQDECLKMRQNIDVMILCGGSANDLMEQSPKFVQNFNIVDSFDTHAKAFLHYKNVNKIAKNAGKIGVVCIGWDPGLFSLNRLIMQNSLPNGKDYTFWGKGVSQGHSDAIRRIKGVADAIQYTIPIQATINSIKDGKFSDFSAREKHRRECFVVLKNDCENERKRVENAIKTMPNYFDEYDTTIHFISQKELNENHSSLPHGGFVIRTGNTQSNNGINSHIMEFNLKLDSNPEFTASVLVAYARAAYRLEKMGQSGARTIFEIPAYLASKNDLETLINTML